MANKLSVSALRRGGLAGAASLLAALVGACSGGSSTASTPVQTPVASVNVSSLSLQTASGTTSAGQSITLSNTGNGALSISGITIAGTDAGAFAQTNNCGTSVSAGGSCSISVTFAPTAVRSFAATLSIADNAAGSPQSVALTGTGTTPPAPSASLSVNALSFSGVTGTTTAGQSVTLTNNGNAALTLSFVAVTGADAASFGITNGCGGSLAAGASCMVTVTFSPAGVRTYSAQLGFTDNAAGSPQTVMLTGTGTAPAAPTVSLSTSSLTFSAAAEATSGSQSVTVTNTGNAALSINSVSVTGTNAANFASTNNCASSIAPQGTCTISVTFTPSMAASFSGQIAIASNAAGSPATVGLSGTGTGTLTINTANASDWQISNGAMTLDWNSTSGNVFAVHLTGYPDNMVDTTTISSNGQPDGLYMDNVGTGSGTVTAGYSQNGSEYIDWWISTASGSSNAFTHTRHFILTANDTGFHVYSTVSHGASDIAGGIGQWQYVFRINLNQFTETYEVNSGLGNLGVIDTPLPSPSVTGTADPGRQVQNAAVDLHGLPLPTGFTRQFFTKYDYSSYEYLHQEHGVYGSKYGAWLVLPSTETLVGGPTKQDLVFTDNILMMEALSGHLDNSLSYNVAAGVTANKLFGPYYFHFNAFNATNTTPAQLYSEAQKFLPSFPFLYDQDTTLQSAGYTPSSGRGAVTGTIAGTGTSTPYQAWTVLSDNSTNFQYSVNGEQYWLNNPASGAANFSGVAPGTYRLSAYVLGQWGELRQNNVQVAANSTTTLPALTFKPENFGSNAPIWTIGTPDRSAHEFLHGHDAAGNDLRNYWGAYNFWADFAANQGGQVYYATAVGSTPATNDLSQINYVQWGVFDPGLYAGIYNASDDTTDGYNYIVPAYVGAANVATARSPGLTIHFTTTAGQQAQGQYAVLSAGLAAAEGSVVATLNGHQLVWHYINASDAMIRSGLAGYYQWLALQWPVSQLNAPGQDNVLTLTVSQTYGVMYDALRMEITNTSADPAVTGWSDYEYVNSSKYTPAADGQNNP